ncbi:MAG TPA: DUF4349 domain-containing protein [Candidatus Limnocylindrales bacterium]|jgi:hypothetical protein|nr:DUF4349 domain-containing protein [Candidatus Limnocylindrales bacterium]
MRTKGFLAAALILVTLAAIGCSSSSAAPTPPNPGFPIDGAQATPAGLPDNGFAGPTAAPAASAVNGSDTTGGITLQTGAPGAAAPEDRIIKTGSITIEVADIDVSVALATDQMHVLGGLMAGSDRTTSSGSGSLASVTYRVPVDRFEDAVSLMRKLGKKVIAEHSDSQSVGGQIVDLQARIDNLKASEKAVQAIMDKATTIADVLSVQQRLSDVQGQIEELTAQLAGLTDKSAYSTLTVIFEVPQPGVSPTPSPQPSATPGPWSAGEQFNQAAAELGGVGQNAATAAIWVVVLILPVTLALLLLLLALTLIAKVLDPLRRRLLPFTVAQPVQHRQVGWGSPYPAGAPLPQSPATWPAPGSAVPPAEQPGSAAPGTDPDKPQL